jgi:hypothetical protein
MLQGYPTKNGTGISIFGDFADLDCLYETVHEIAESLDENDIQLKGQWQLLLNFAYDIRKAYSGERLTDKVKFNGDDHEIPYFGFQCVWTDILIFISTLRQNAGYLPTNKKNQANLYRLEYVVEKALFSYDEEGANIIHQYIGQRINVANPYAFIIFQALHIKFLSYLSGKRRFRNIPKLIENHFSQSRRQYKNLIRAFEFSLNEYNCEISELEYTDFTDFEDIKW